MSSQKSEKKFKKYEVDAKVRNFIGQSKLFFIIIAVVVVVSLASTFLGVNVALEFKGGTIITYSYEGDIVNSDLESAITDLVGSSVTAQTGDSLEGGEKTVTLSFTSTEGLTIERQDEVTAKFVEMYPDSNPEVLDANDVAASSGHEFFVKCIVAAIFAAAILIIYIAFRFKAIAGWTAGICAVLGLIVTLIATYGGVQLMRFDIDSNFMAVILTLLGYSINDTIVIYDRIRENQTTLPGMSIEDLVNISASQSLRRSIRTSVTTVSSMIIVSVVAAVMGLTSILSFSIPISIGIIVGTYNSLCFVPALWVFWQKKRGIDSLKPIKKKVKGSGVAV